MLGDTNGDFKRKLLGKTEEKVRGYRSVALNHYCGNGYALCVMISRKLGLVWPSGEVSSVFGSRSGLFSSPCERPGSTEASRVVLIALIKQWRGVPNHRASWPMVATTGRSLSKKQRITNAGQDGLLQVRVSSSRNPAGGGGDGTNDFAGTVHGEIIIEHGASGRLTVGLDQVLEFFPHFNFHQVSAARSRLDLDDREPAHRLQGGFEAVGETHRIRAPGFEQGCADPGLSDDRPR